MLARCTAPLSALLRSKPVVRLVNHPLVSVRTSEVIANITVEIRLALPLSELYRLFLERHPQERHLIEDISNKRIIENNNMVERSKLLGSNSLMIQPGVVKEDESRMFNELEVTIVAADGLQNSSDNQPPSPYVLFQLLGHPDKFTNISENTNNPAFNERFYFPMITNDATIRLLRRSQLLLTILDMREEELFDGNNIHKSDADLNGMLGEVNISLAALSDGAPINDFFTIRSGDNKNVGRIRVVMKWKNPFRRPRDLGPRALSDVDVETLVAKFGAGVENEGGVDYKAFVRFVDPPSTVNSAITRLRQYAHRLSDKEGLSYEEIFSTVLDHKNGKDTSSAGLREDAFIAAMISLEVDILPAEYSQLFRYIDLNSTGVVTVHQLIAVLNLDEAAAIADSLQEKLKSRVHDLESRNVSVLKLFERADNWGMKGVVTRLEFKSVLCQMGFQLSDEPAALNSERDISRDRLVSGSIDGIYDGEVIHPSSARTSQHDNISGGKHLSAEAQRQREIFQLKLNEIQARTREAARNAPPRDSREMHPPPRAATSSVHSKDEVIGLNLLQERGAEAPSDHKSSVHAAASVSLSQDAAAISLSAVKVQSIYRGHHARKQIFGREEKSPGIMGQTPTSTKPPLNARGRESARDNQPQPKAEVPRSSSPAAGCSIIQAERMLRAALLEMQQTNGPINLINNFVTLDGKRRGFVNRQQFAMALRQHKHLPISPEALRVFMDYFDTSGTGADIDYNAFVIFAGYKELEMLPASRIVNSMAASKESVDILRSLDANGTGYLKRQEMLRGLAEIGYGQFSQSQSQSIMALFETDIDGHVNFGNLMEYCMTSPMGQAYAELEESLLGIISARGNQDDDADLHRWFRKIDASGQGTIDLRALSLFFDQFDVHPPKPAVAALCRNMALSSNGRNSGDVGFKEFAAWYRSKIHTSSDYSSLFQQLSPSELQRKAAAYLLAMAMHRDGSLNEIAQSFQVYDWKKPSISVIGKSEFYNAALRAGFLFTPNELNFLSTEFASGNGGVCYRKFLSWATPTAPRNVPDEEIEKRDSVQAASSIAKLLQKGLRKGIDLLSVFGRYDTTGAGRITCDEFCAALSDLGCSSVSRREATDFADRYRAAVGNLILYRRIVTELLRQIDDNADPAGGKGMGDITDIVAAKLTKEGVDIHRIRDLFEYYDRKSIGHVRIEDLPIVFEEANVPLRRYELDAITDRFAGRRAAGGDYEGYIQYPVFVNALQLKMGPGAFGRIGRGTAGLQSSSTDLEAKIAGALETAIMLGKDFRAAFDAFDDKFVGAISVASFKSVWVKDLTADLGEAELDTLCMKYRDRDDPRLVCHVRLILELHPRLYSGLRSGASEFRDISNLELAEKLRQKVRRRYDYLTPGELRSPFCHFAGGPDVTTVTLEDFSIGLRKLGMRLAADQEKAIFDLINIENGRGFQYSDFVTFVCDPLYSDVVWKFRRLMARNRVSNDEIIETITAVDTNASGLITSRQFSKAMRTCRIDLSESDISRLLLRFDIEGNQRFDVDAFVYFLKGTSGQKGQHDHDKILGPATVESTESRSLNALKNGVQQKLNTGYTAAEIFALFDPDDKRAIDLASLQEGARELGVAINRAEARGILRRMSVLAGGTVDRGTFFSALDIDAGHRSRRKRDGSLYPDDSNHRDRAGSDSPRSSREVDSSKARELLKSLKTDLISKSASGDRGSIAKDLLRILDDADSDADGKVSSNEFIRAIGTLNTQHTRSELAFIFDYCIITSKSPARSRLISTKNEQPFLSTSEFIDILFDSDDISGTVSSNRYSSKSPGRRDSLRHLHGDMLECVEKVLAKRPDFVDAILAQLVVAKEKGASLRDFLLACEDFDLDRSGFVRKSDFAKALHRAAINLKSIIERDLLDSLDEAFTNASRSRISKGLHYGSFVSAVENELKAEDEADEVLAKLRRNISRSMKEGNSIEDIFNRMDKDRRGRISVDEFEDGLRSIGISVSRDDSKRIASKFSSMGGSINYREFVKAFLPHRGDAADTEFIESMIRRIRNTLMDRMGSYALSKRQMQKVFEDIDVDGDGSLSIKELKNAMAQLKVRI